MQYRFPRGAEMTAPWWEFFPMRSLEVEWGVWYLKRRFSRDYVPVGPVNPL